MKKYFFFLFLLMAPLSLSADSIFDSPYRWDTWEVGDSVTIEWDSSKAGGVGGNGRLLLFKNSSKVSTIVSSVSVSREYYTWNEVKIGSAAPGGGFKVALCPTSSTNYDGCLYSDSFTINGGSVETPAPRVVPFISVSPSSIGAGQEANLSWGCNAAAGVNYAECLCYGSWVNTGTLRVPFSSKVSPPNTTTYTIRCTDKSYNGDPEVKAETTLRVSSEPFKAWINAEPKTLRSPGEVKLSWGCNRSCKCTNSWRSGSYDPGSQNIQVSDSKTFAVSCSSGSDISNAQELVFVDKAAPEVNLKANPSRIQVGESSKLSWTSTNANSCKAASPQGWTSKTTTSGEEVVSPTSSTTYKLTCSGPYESRSGSVLVEVLPAGTLASPEDTERLQNEKDTDQDGVPDGEDKCPDTKPNHRVNKDGCWEMRPRVRFKCDLSNPSVPTCKEAGPRESGVEMSYPVCMQKCQAQANSCSQSPSPSSNPPANSTKLPGYDFALSSNIDQELENFIKGLNAGNTLVGIIVDGKNYTATFIDSQRNKLVRKVNFGSKGISGVGEGKNGDGMTPSGVFKISGDRRFAAGGKTGVRILNVSINVGPAFINIGAKDEKGNDRGVAFHGSEDNGLVVTDACIRMYNDDLKKLASYMTEGVTVEIQKGCEKPGRGGRGEITPEEKGWASIFNQLSLVLSSFSNLLK